MCKSPRAPKKKKTYSTYMDTDHTPRPQSRSFQPLTTCTLHLETCNQSEVLRIAEKELPLL